MVTNVYYNARHDILGVSDMPSTIMFIAMDCAWYFYNPNPRDWVKIGVL